MLRSALRLIAIAILGIWLLAACGGPERTPAPATTAVGERTATAIATALPSATPVPTPIPPTMTPTAEATAQFVLPAPLYYIDQANGQIERLETDGLTRRAITDEATRIGDFDVSTEDGSLIYVAGNQLVQADATGGNRTVKVAGESYDPQSPDGVVNLQISAPRFSPDGKQIAFGLGGVNLIASGVYTDYIKLVANSTVPDPAAPGTVDEPARFFRPSRWSPDGKRLIVDFSYYPEAGGLAILKLDNGALIELVPSSIDTPVIGDTAWAPDSRSFYIGSNLVVYGAPGLSFTDASDGTVIPILTSDSGTKVGKDNPVTLVRAPHVAQDGTPWAFVARQASLSLAPKGYVMASIATHRSELTALNDLSYAVDGEVLWAADDSGAAFLTNLTFGDDGAYGELVWAPVAGSPPVPLPVSGRALRWGPAIEMTTSPFTLPTSQPAPPSLETDESATVAALLEASLDLDAVRSQANFPVFDATVAFPVVDAAGTTYWVAHTTGMRSFDPDVPHVLAVYEPDGESWREVSRYAFVQGVGSEQLAVGPDFLAPNGVNQISIEPTRLWLHVEGGVGAHSGTCNILSFDGTSLTMEAAAGNASPGVCGIQDVNGDGQNEVIVDESDAYVFCYACGVRLPNFGVLRWDGGQLTRVELEALPSGAPDALNQLNDEVLRLVKAGLWKSALSTVEGSRIVGAVPSGVIAWNAGLVRLTGEARRGPAERPDHPFPLLARLFYGDYPGALDVMRPYSATAIFDQPSAIIEGTVASGWESEVSYWITSTVEPALQVQPSLAGAHFLRGYALWLQDPADPNAIRAIDRAAQLSPDGPMFVAAAALLGETQPPENATPATESPATIASAPATAPVSGKGTLYYSAQLAGLDTILSIEIGDSTAAPQEVLTQASQPALIRGGRRLAYHSSRDDMLGLGGYDLETGERFNFTSNLEDSVPRWHPTEARLAFSSLRYGDGRSRVYLVWADSVSEAEDMREGADPDWSPDGGRLVYRGCDTQGASCGLWTMNADGSVRRALTNNPGDARPRWSPDGRKIVFMSDQRDGNWELYTVDVGNGAVGRLTQNPANDGLPAFSPDGGEIAFVSDRGGAWGIWRVPTEGGAAQAVLEDMGAMPSWLDHGLDWVE